MSDLPLRPQVQLLVLDRIVEAQNMARYYVLSIEPTLFDQVSLVREWGRIGKRGGRRVELHTDNTSAGLALESWFARKVKRGYQKRLDS
jgi:predicted DNA-binding WGR domain protein